MSWKVSSRPCVVHACGCVFVCVRVSEFVSNSKVDVRTEDLPVWHYFVMKASSTALKHTNHNCTHLEAVVDGSQLLHEPAERGVHVLKHDGFLGQLLADVF